MAEYRYDHYVFGGWQRILIYSELEMATALNLTVDQLHAQIKKGKYCYHYFNRDSGQYEFNQRAYDENLQRLEQQRQPQDHS